MSKFNPKAEDKRASKTERLAGGFGLGAAVQDPEALLKRAVYACLLWEDMAYEDGSSNAENIQSLVPKVDPRKVAQIAIAARHEQKLRHVPLWIIVQMLKSKEHKVYARETINKVITRVDQMMDLVALYWKDKTNKKSLPKQMRLGLQDCFLKFDEYQFAKYDRDLDIKLRDVIRLVHPRPPEFTAKAALWKRVAKRELLTPDTWEVSLSAGKDKKETWERLIRERKLGNLAFLRNLRNMTSVGVSDELITRGLEGVTDKGILPLNFFAAAKECPKYAAEIEAAMFRAYSNLDKLPGRTLFIIDVSGSMSSSISSKSSFNRIEAGAAMAVLARERCERAFIYTTAGNDGLTRGHKTALLPNHRGWGLAAEIKACSEWGTKKFLGGGGIYTRQCLNFIKSEWTMEKPDRIIVFSDSQDCDFPGTGLPDPFGVYNYIIDVSAHKHGINYRGVWDAEISGWSEHFLSYIAAIEGLSVQSNEE